MIKEANLLEGINKPWNARTVGIVPHDSIYYGKCLIGGALACGSTHLVITPLDVTKCNMQVNLLIC
jgi:solute carrier family 25 phosphate transporter 3